MSGEQWEARSIKSVLFVDDQVRFLKRLAARIAKTRTVHTASSASDAIEILAAHEVDLAFVDVLMPGTNGIELLVALRATLPDLRVIMFSGLWSAKSMRAALLAGAFDCIEKGDADWEAIIGRCERGEGPETSAGPFQMPTLEQVIDEFYQGLVEVYGSIMSAARSQDMHRTALQKALRRAQQRRLADANGSGVVGSTVCTASADRTDPRAH